MASHTIKFRQKLSLSFKEGKVSGMQQTCLLLAPKYEELASLLAKQKESNWRALIQRCRAAIYNTHPLAGKRKASAFTSQGRALQLIRMAWGGKQCVHSAPKFYPLLKIFLSLQSWLLDWVTFIATLPWIALLALSAYIECTLPQRQGGHQGLLVGFYGSFKCVNARTVYLYHICR